jgi:hypothetical protein
VTDTNLKIFVLLAAALPGAAVAQPRAIGVCEALNSVPDHQAVAIRAKLWSGPHGLYLIQGNKGDPCPDWPRHLFTTPSSIPVWIGSYEGVHVSADQQRPLLDLIIRVRRLQDASPTAQSVVTLSGVFLRKKWVFIFRYPDGSYRGAGFGPDGGSAAVFVATSVLADR